MQIISAEGNLASDLSCRNPLSVLSRPSGPQLCLCLPQSSQCQPASQPARELNHLSLHSTVERWNRRAPKNEWLRDTEAKRECVRESGKEKKCVCVCVRGRVCVAASEGGGVGDLSHWDPSFYWIPPDSQVLQCPPSAAWGTTSASHASSRLKNRPLPHHTLGL